MTLDTRQHGAVLFAEIAAPPMNLMGAELVRDLVSLIQRAEADTAVKVVVLTGEASLGLLFRHLSASRLVTIAQIEGRVRGAGSEFVLACDLFADGVRTSDYQRRFEAAMKRGFQSRSAELDLGGLLGDLE